MQGRGAPLAASVPPLSSRVCSSRAGIGRALSTGYCRLCHGKFSSRSLRHAFGKVPVLGESSEKQRRVDQVFFADFQRLVGVAVRQDPALPQFVCKKCHAQFYKCRSVLRTFIQRVNASPTGHAKSKGKYVAFLTSREQCCPVIPRVPPSCPVLPHCPSVTPKPHCAPLVFAGPAGSRHSRVWKEVPPAWVSAHPLFLSASAPVEGWDDG